MTDDELELEEPKKKKERITKVKKPKKFRIKPKKDTYIATKTP